MEGALLDIQKYSAKSKTYISLYLKPSGSSDVVEFKDFFVPAGPRSVVENYMSFHRIKPFDILYVEEIGDTLRITRMGRFGAEDLGKLSMLTFDLEGYNPYRIPDPMKDRIIAFGIGKEVFAEEDEAETIIKGMEHFEKYDPHVVITHNGDSFDFHVLLTRARILGIEKYVLSKLGRGEKRLKHVNEKAEFSEKRALGLPGRINLDILHFCRYYIPTLNSKLETVASFYGIETGKERPERFFEYFDQGNLKPIVEHCRKDVNATGELGRMILHCLLELSGLAYAPFYAISRRRPQAIDGLITDACLVDREMRLTRRGSYIMEKRRKKEKRRKLLSKEERISLAGFYDYVGHAYLGSHYLKALRRMAHPIAWTAGKIHDEYTHWQRLVEDHDDVDRTCLMMFDKLARDLYQLISDPNSPYHYEFFQYMARKIKEEIKEGILNDKVRTAIYLDDNILIFEEEPSPQKAIVFDNRYVLSQDSITGRLVKPRGVSEFSEEAYVNFIDYALSDLPSVIRYHKRLLRMLSSGEVHYSSLMRTITKTRARDEIIRPTRNSTIVEKLEGRYDVEYDKGERVPVVKTLEGFVDVRRETPVGLDVDYYVAELNEVLQPLFRAIGYDHRAGFIQKKLFG